MAKPIEWLRDTIVMSGKPTITLMVGIPGSGKSHWLQTHAIDVARIISSDNLIEQWAMEHNKTYSEAFNEPGLFKQIDKQMKANLDLALSNKEHIIVDRTNVSKASRNKILCKVPKDYLKFAAVIRTSRDTVDKRLEVRNQTGKIIPKSVVDSMHQNFEHPTTEEFNEIFVNEFIPNYDD